MLHLTFVQEDALYLAIENSCENVALLLVEGVNVNPKDVRFGAI